MNDLNATRFFNSVAWKRLKMIDLPGRGSNQHELQGIGPLKRLLGDRKREGIKALWRRFDREGELCESGESQLTWYDARELNPKRSAEWRLYYPPNTPLENAQVGDLLIAGIPNDLGIAVDANIILYLIDKGSELHGQVIWALGLSKPSERFSTLGQTELETRRLRVSEEEILERLEPRLTFESIPFWHEDHVRKDFFEFLVSPKWESFPSSKEMAAFAWRYISEADSGWDETLMILLEIETRAFMLLERELLELKLKNGFDDADDFLEYALKVQNRRKSRRGYSLEHHLEWIFNQNELLFETQVQTEGKSTVDFLFPNAMTYEELGAGDPTGVIMLAAKTTCKDRWRQVLAEAAKLDRRHLFTLEPAISSSQTDEMGRNQLTLVVPESHRSSFVEPGTEILNLMDFIDLVRKETDQPERAN